MPDWILEVAARINKASSADGVLREVRRVLEELGVKHYAFNMSPRDGEKWEDINLAFEAPPVWMELTRRDSLHLDDPAVLFAKTAIQPFSWSKAPLMEPRHRSMRELAQDYKIDKGLMIPVPGRGMVWFHAEDGHDLEPIKLVLQALGLHVFHRLELLVDLPRKEIALTPREREVITWVALGKTDWDIGEILKISSRTVEWHIQHVMKKLGATSRTQAAVLAFRDGLIAV